MAPSKEEGTAAATWTCTQQLGSMSLCESVGRNAKKKGTEKTPTLTKKFCSACGKGSDTLKQCNGCKCVWYCDKKCQDKHRKQHKKECKKRAAELQDEKLFKQPPSSEDCPICMLRLPFVGTGKTYMACCGKVICRGCAHAFQSRAVKAGRLKEDDICPFCRTPFPESNEEMFKRYKKRVEQDDPIATRHMGFMYRDGENGLLQNRAKALELWHRAGELGHAKSNFNTGFIYDEGEGVGVDKEKAIHYYELAAIQGLPEARHSLGLLEKKDGNMDRALKHYMIAAAFGYSDSLKQIKQLYTDGHATRDDYTNALRVYQAYLDEIKSVQRDTAAAARDEYKYY